MQRIICAYPESKLREVGSPYWYSTCQAEAFNERGIGWGNEISKDRKPLGCWGACYIYVLFNCARNTMKGTEFITSSDGLIRVFCRNSGLVS
jgi:hypothetical protein